MAGTSARFNDAQHTGEHTLIEYPDSSEMRAWETEVTDSTAKATDILGMTCPNVCLYEGGSEPWWQRHLSGT